jgi:metal-responsive CopG/Arc/MetJ family transcriptional regulator
MVISKYSKYVQLGISLPKEIVNTIDEIRKDVPRSRYILRLLENSLPFFECEFRKTTKTNHTI